MSLGLREETTEFLSRWRRLVPRRRNRFSADLPRGAAALGYLTHGLEPPEYIEINRLVLVVLYDEPAEDSLSPLRLCGLVAHRVEHGMQWGGTKHCPLFKDLGLVPKLNANGVRVDTTNTRLLELGLRLERRLQQAERFGYRHTHAAPKLPRLWAAFRARDAAGLTGGGPEFEEIRQRFGFEPRDLLAKFRRDHFGLALYPLEWVSDQLTTATSIYAELTRFPRMQTFRVRRFPDSLIGYHGACAFDFYASSSRASPSVHAA